MESYYSHPGVSVAVFDHVYLIFPDKDVVYQSSVTNAVAVWSQEAMCVGEMLQGGHTLAALATLMFSPHRLQQVKL